CSTVTMSSIPPTKPTLPSSDGLRKQHVSPETSGGDPLRVAVIGVGHLGRHHARILSALEGAHLTAVVDTIDERAREVAATTGATALSDSPELLGSVDAVTVAGPTELHEQIAMPFLERGVAVLVEKPMARSLEEADRMLAAARASGATLAVGHTERYNPAVA